MHADVVILGGGLSGLGCARLLPGARVFDAATHPGGHVHSDEVGGVSFDQGAHICHSRDRAWLEMITKAAGSVVRIPRSRVLNHWHGHWVGYPVQNHLRNLPVDDRIAALSDFVGAQASRTERPPAHYEEWLRTQYGSFLTERFYAEYTAKYWRVPMAELATDWLGGRLLPSQIPRIISGAFTEETESQAVFNEFIYPSRGGFFGFFAPLYREVPVELGARAVEVDLAEKTVRFADGRSVRFATLVSSIPLPDLVAITREAPNAVRIAASLLRHTQLLCVNLVVRKTGLTPCHWFYVYDPEIEIARVKVISNLTPGAVPPGCTALQAEIYRRNDETMDAPRLAAQARDDLGRLLGFGPDDIVAAGTRHVTHAYTISDLNRARSVELISAWFAAKGVYLTGLYGRWHFVWSDAAFRQGEETARAIHASH